MGSFLSHSVLGTPEGRSSAAMESEGSKEALTVPPQVQLRYGRPVRQCSGSRKGYRGEIEIKNGTNRILIFEMIKYPDDFTVTNGSGLIFPNTSRRITIVVGSQIPHQFRLMSAVCSWSKTEGMVYKSEMWQSATKLDLNWVKCVYADSSGTDEECPGAHAETNSNEKKRSRRSRNSTGTSNSSTPTRGRGQIPVTPPPPASSPEFKPYVPTQQLAEANELYKKVQSAVVGMSRPTKRAQLEKANVLYGGEILKCLAAQDSKAAASVLRNKGMTNLRLAEIIDNLEPTQEFAEIIYFLREAIESFVKALQTLKADFDKEWGLGVQEKIQNCFEIGLTRGACRGLEHEGVMIGKLSKLLDVIPEEVEFNPLRTKCHLLQAEKFYNRAVVLLECYDFRSTLRYLEYSREENENALKFSKKNKHLMREVAISQKENFMMKCSCESVRMRCQADALFNEQINDNESVDLRLMWNIVDMYKEAVLLTRENDIENEAFALSRLGRTFDKVLKMRVKAHKYYRDAFDLVQTLLPKDMTTAEWYSETKNALERFQKNVVLEEQKREEAEKAPILEKLKPQLNELRKYESDSPAELLKFLYKKHPPKLPFVFKKADVDDHARCKQLLKEAISHYHPDRQAKFGIEWKVLCGEITKTLTVKYEHYKG